MSPLSENLTLAPSCMPWNYHTFHHWPRPVTCACLQTGLRINSIWLHGKLHNCTTALSSELINVYMLLLTFTNFLKVMIVPPVAVDCLSAARCNCVPLTSSDDYHLYCDLTSYDISCALYTTLFYTYVVASWNAWFLIPVCQINASYHCQGRTNQIKIRWGLTILCPIFGNIYSWFNNMLD